MKVEKTEYHGWKNNVKLSNDHVELIVTLDVGPRIISYRALHGKNVFHNFPESIGKSGETEWQNRGGHRIWIAPEGMDISYALDNAPVSKYELTKNGVRVENDPVAPWGIRKEMTVSLAEDSSEVTVRHRLINEKKEPVEIASWGLSVMAAGGLEIIPLPPLGEHPQSLLPNRVIIPWPYTDMSDPRWRFGWKYITLRQTSDGVPAKIGLSHKEKWVAYYNADSLFVKEVEYIEGATYTDLGSNFETFNCSEMLEIETLGPLRKLAPGQSTEHTEKWRLLGDVPQPASLQEEDLAKWLEPLLA